MDGIFNLIFKFRTELSAPCLMLTNTSSNVYQFNSFINSTYVGWYQLKLSPSPYDVTYCPFAHFGDDSQSIAVDTDENQDAKVTKPCCRKPFCKHRRNYTAYEYTTGDKQNELILSILASILLGNTQKCNGEFIHTTNLENPSSNCLT